MNPLECVCPHRFLCLTLHIRARKDTVLSVLVLCGVHTRESSGHTAEKLEEKNKRVLSYRRSDRLRKSVKPQQHSVDISRSRRADSEVHTEESHTK